MSSASNYTPLVEPEQLTQQIAQPYHDCLARSTLSTKLSITADPDIKNPQPVLAPTDISRSLQKTHSPSEPDSLFETRDPSISNTLTSGPLTTRGFSGSKTSRHVERHSLRPIRPQNMAPSISANSRAGIVSTLLDPLSPATHITPLLASSLPSSLFPPDHPPTFSKSKRKRHARRHDSSNKSFPDKCSLQNGGINSPERTTSTSSQAPEVNNPIIHAPAPQRLHTLVPPHLHHNKSSQPPRFLQSVPISEPVHDGIDRGWSTAPSILGGAAAGQASPIMPYLGPHHLRERDIPKRLKNRRVGPERSSLSKEIFQTPRRDFLVPKKPRSTNHETVPLIHAGPCVGETTALDSTEVPGSPDSARSRASTSLMLSHKCQSAEPTSVTPSFDSDDSELDDFVVESSAAYASVMREPHTLESEVAEQGHKLCNSFLNIFRDLERYKRFVNHRGERAQRMVDTMQSLLDGGFVEPQFRVILIVALSRLARKSELYPKRFVLQDVIRQEGTFAEGHFGEVEKGIRCGKSVCIKIPRLNADLRSFRRALSREIVPWAQMNHKNLLPFYGILRLNDKYDRLGLVSPFLENGNVVDFLERKPDADRRYLISGVASGMAHLHENGLVHGDIKGRNILVTSSNPPQACLADFGFTTATDAHGLKSAELSSNAAEGGTRQFEAPELFNPEIPYRRTKASDVYAFSMASYEILTGMAPFPGKREAHILVMVGQGQRPIRPTGQLYHDRGLNNFMWQVIQESWGGTPGMRPSASQIVERLSNDPTWRFSNGLST